MLHHQEGKLARDWVETKKSSTALLSWFHSISVQIDPDGERRVACVPECLEKPHGNDLYVIVNILYLIVRYSKYLTMIPINLFQK